jgi:predicted  nucleic acid-binding Zn-ribbon protein
MKKGFNVKGAAIRVTLIIAMIAIGFCLNGCGKEMAKIEDQQLNLQTMAEANTQQITAVEARIEKNQRELKAELEAVQKNVRNVAADTAAVSERQTKLQQAMQNGNRQTTNKIIQLEENQNELKTGIEQARDNTQNVAADMAADITTVKDEQARLNEIVQSNSRQFTNSMAVIEQNQQQWQSKVEDLHQNLQEVTARMSTLSDDLSKLQEAFQSNVKELVSAMDLSSKEQLKFQEKIQKNLMAFDNSISAIKQSQAELQNQIKNVQQSAEVMSNELPAAIEQLREEIARNREMEAEENQPPPETNSTE